MYTWQRSGWFGRRALDFPQTAAKTPLERYAHADLRREWNSHRCARSEEISETTLRNFKLLQPGDGCSLRAIGNGTDAGHVCDALRVGLHLRLRDWELHDVRGEVRTRIVVVEKIEKLDKRINMPALVDLDGPRDAQIGLNVRCAAEFVQAGVYPVHVNARAVVAVRDREGARALDLIDGTQFESAGQMHGAS